MNSLLKFILSTKVGDLWLKFAIFLLIILFLLRRKRIAKMAGYEGFQQKDQFVVKTGIDVYDDFYSTIYDLLNLDKDEINNIVDIVVKNTQITDYSSILDINAKTGELCHSLNVRGIKCTGIEKSPYMVDYAKYKYCRNKEVCIVAENNYENTMMYDSGIFSHVVCLGIDGFYALGEREEQKKVLFNVHKWLKCGGYFIVQLVDKTKYNMLSRLYNNSDGNGDDNGMNGAHNTWNNTANNIDDETENNGVLHWLNMNIFNNLGWKFSFSCLDNTKHGGINKAVVDYGDFEYKCEFNECSTKVGKSAEKVTKTETFVDKKTGSVRKNEIDFNISRLEDDVAFIESCGFIQKGKIGNIRKKVEHEYIYLFQKMDVVDFV
jgi:hypothetical protein